MVCRWGGGEESFVDELDRQQGDKYETVEGGWDVEIQVCSLLPVFIYHLSRLQTQQAT